MVVGLIRVFRYLFSAGGQHVEGLGAWGAWNAAGLQVGDPALTQQLRPELGRKGASVAHKDNRHQDIAREVACRVRGWTVCMVVVGV